MKKLILAFLMWVSTVLPSQNLNNHSDAAWSTLAKEDLKTSRQLIESHHPAFVDKEQEHPQFHQWITDGYNQALKLADHASSFEEYRDILAFYIAGFRDGHFSISTTQNRPVLWPTFLLTYRDGKFLIATKLPLVHDTPPQGAEVIAINHKPPSLLMESNLFPYVNDDPSIESSWTRLAPFLLIDDGHPWAEKIDTITYRLNDVELEHTLKWVELERDKIFQYTQLAAYGPSPEFSIHEFGDEGTWVSIPTFNSQRKGAKESLQKIIDQVPKIKSKKCIVFDLRGNTGGSSSWVVKILIALYGKEYLGSLPHIKNANALADDRLTLEMIHRLEKQIAENIGNDQGLMNRYQKVKAAYESDVLLMRRSTDAHIFSEIKQAGLHAPNPISGKVYLLTDGRCFSSGLIFADSILSIPGVVHIGTTTKADTRFSQPILIQLPSGRSDLRVPTMIRRNWERGDNEPYRPDYVFHGYMGDKQELESWVVSLNNADHKH